MSETIRLKKGFHWQTATLICVIGALLVKLIFFGFDAQQLQTLVRTNHLINWVAIGTLVYLFGFVLRGIRLRWLVELDCQLNLLTAMNTIMVGHAVNCIVPFRIGEPVQAGILHDRTGISFVQSLAVVALQRIFDLSAIVVILLLATSNIPLQGFMVEWRQYSIAFCLMFGVTALAAATIPRWALSVTSLVTYKATPSIHNRLISILHDILRAFKPFRSLTRTTKIFCLSLAIWSVESLFFACIMNALLLPFSLQVASAVMSYTNLSIAFPTAPAFSGQYHLSSVHSLLTLFASKSQINVDAITALNFGALVHITFLAVTSTWGLIALTSYAVRKGSVALSKMETQPLLEAPKESPFSLEVLASMEGDSAQAFKPSPFWYALAEGLIGEEIVTLVDSQRKEIFQETIRFVLETLSALPALLRLQLWVGITGFRCIVGVLYMRPFTSMSLQQRCKIVRNWAEGPIPVFRKLFRPLRSLTFLGFFEDTRVHKLLQSTSMSKAEHTTEAKSNG